MINRTVIVNYIRAMDEENAKLFASRFGIYFDDSEIAALLPYLKRSAEALLDSPDPFQKAEADLRGSVSAGSIRKLALLMQKMGIR